MIGLQEIDQRRRLVITVSVALVLLVSWSGVIDYLSKEYVNASTVQALAAYGTARVINAAVSLASSISVSASLGIGFDIQPFQVLDPINDLVEQYSSAMKFSISSLVVQKIVVEAISTLFFKVVLTLLGLAFIVSIYIRNGVYSFLLFRVFAFFAMIRFLIVMVVMMNGVVNQAFVDRNISPSMQEVEMAANQLERNESSESGLSKDERQGLIDLQEELESERVHIVEQISTHEKVLEESQADLIPVQEKVDSLEDEMGTIEKLNVFSREDEYVQVSEELEEAVAQVEQEQGELDELIDKRNKLNEDIQNTIDMIAGNNVNEGWFASMRNKMSEFQDMARWERIVTTVEDIIPSLLNLMAAFLFKTLIMPLIFLALLLKGFKYIWGVDPRKWAKDEYIKMKKIED